MHNRESSLQLLEGRKSDVRKNSILRDSETHSNKAYIRRSYKNSKKGRVYLPVKAVRLICSSVVDAELRPVLMVGMGRSSVSKKTGIIRRATSAVFYLNKEKRLSILCARIFNDKVELLPYEHYRLKSRLIYVSTIHERTARYYSRCYHNRVGCPVLASVFVL